MKFYEQQLKGVYLIKPPPFKDERGVFRRHFCSQEFLAHNITKEVLQSNISENNYKFTLRGFHYQVAPHGEGKTLSCLNGNILLVQCGAPLFLFWALADGCFNYHNQIRYN